MAPAKPTRKLVARALFQDDPEQAGRSATSLHAHSSAAYLREEDRRSAPRKQSNPHLLRKNNPPADRATNVPTLSSASESPGRQNAAPEASPALVPLASASTRDRISSGGILSSNEEAREPGNSKNYAAAVTGTVIAPPLVHQFSQSSQVHLATRAPRSTTSSGSFILHNTPRTVRELGSDYTRYYNPYVPRRPPTYCDRPLSRYETASSNSSVEDGYKRLSDPFDDKRRISDPLDFKYAATALAADSALSNHTSTTAENADPEKAFFPYLDDRLGAPGAEQQGYNFPLYWDEKEVDDDMHLPMIDDNTKLKASWQDHFSRENVVSTFGMAFMLIGLLCIFIVLPVLSSTGLSIIHYTSETPLDQMGGSYEPAAEWATVNNRAYPLMANVRTGLIDPDTPQDAMTRTALDGSTLNLVFSDEFNAQNRTFLPGDDPFWFGLDGWYGATLDLEWYDPDAISTWDGTLELRLDKFENHNLAFRSGMLNSWNQLCFKGGVFEVSVSLPGPGGVHGLWPGVWSMGNLGRPGYLATSDGMWPYTYNECDSGITPNQSMSDGTSKLSGQRLPSCTCPGADHPTPGTGRGAPEIDIIEVSGDWGGQGIAVATQSFQVAPFDVWWYPNYEYMETPNYSTSFVNTYTGGPFQQAISTTTMLNNSWYDGELYQKYAYEYKPGSDEDSGIAWYVGDDISMRFDARAIGPNGNIGQRLISEEPMSLVLNLGISNNWVDIDWAALIFPTVMRVDYVRWYQAEGQESVTCDPPGYETTEYIANHPEAYNNPNYTRWDDIPGYAWPQNTLMSDCS